MSGRLFRVDDKIKSWAALSLDPWFLYVDDANYKDKKMLPSNGKRLPPLVDSYCRDGEKRERGFFAHPLSWCQSGRSYLVMYLSFPPSHVEQVYICSFFENFILYFGHQRARQVWINTYPRLRKWYMLHHFVHYSLFSSTVSSTILLNTGLSLQI